MLPEPAATGAGAEKLDRPAEALSSFAWAWRWSRDEASYDTAGDEAEAEAPSPGEAGPAVGIFEC